MMDGYELDSWLDGEGPPYHSSHWSLPDPHFASRHRITSRDAIYVIEEVERKGRGRGPWWNIAGWLSRGWALVLGVRH